MHIHTNDMATRQAADLECFRITMMQMKRELDGNLCLYLVQYWENKTMQKCSDVSKSLYRLFRVENMESFRLLIISVNK